MDLRTFHRNGPGLAECESQAAWCRLWADHRGHWPRDTHGPVSNVAASWPQFGYRGQTIERVARRTRDNLPTELGFEVEVSRKLVSEIDVSLVAFTPFISQRGTPTNVERTGGAIGVHISSGE
jgi:hypothetical protein